MGEPPKAQMTRRRRIRTAVFVVAVAASVVLLFAGFAASPFANPYEGSRSFFIIAIPVTITIVMAVLMWWLIRHAGRDHNTGRDYKD